MSRKINIDGLGALQKRLNEIKRQDLIERVVRQNTLEYHNKVVRASPVDTGELRGSIAFGFSDGGRTGNVGTNKKYAPYLEFGTIYITPRRFFGGAFDDQKRQFISDLRRLAE